VGPHVWTVRPSAEWFVIPGRKFAGLMVSGGRMQEVDRAANAAGAASG
jgi:hypothetical protein